MQNRNYVLFFLLVIGINSYAQREADVFIHGSCYVNIPMGFNCQSPEANILFHFDEDTLLTVTQGITLNLATSQGRAAFAQRRTGELLFASNGWRLINGSGEILTHKLWRDDIPWPEDSFDSTMTLTNMGPLFLNHPADSNKAYLFYGQYLRGIGPELLPVPKADRYFTYALLDIPTQTLISKNNIVLDEWTNDGDMQACRHANGRDWWIIKPGVYEDELYIGLLDPQGLQMQKIIIPEMPHEGQLETFSFFSMDGNKYLHFSHKPNKRLHVFDFDRCSGTLSYQSGHNLVDSLQASDYNGCNISPDGSKFYVRRSNNFEGTIIGGTCQYDIETGNFKWLRSSGSNPMLSPNGKHIYFINSVNTGNGFLMYLGIIKNPNEAADDLIVDDQVLLFTNVPTPVAPSCFANFRLGKLEGSSCDTIVNHAAPVNDHLAFKLYPNPSSGIVNLNLAQWSGGSYSLHNSLGQQVAQASLPATSHEQMFTLAFRHLPAGLYFLSLRNHQGQMLGSKRLMIRRE